MFGKPFDCVEMKRQGAEHVRQLLAGMTREQRLAFWRQRTEELRADQQRQRAAEGKATHRNGCDRAGE